MINGMCPLLSMLAKPLEQIYVPCIAGWNRNGIEMTDSLKDVLYAAVKLGEKGSGGGFFTDSRLSFYNIIPQAGKFTQYGFNQLKLYTDFFSECTILHIRVLPLASMSLVKRFGGFKGITSKGTPVSS